MTVDSFVECQHALDNSVKRMTLGRGLHSSTFQLNLSRF